MKIFSLIIFCLTLFACSSQPIIKRTHIETYEKQIGFAQVVQYGDRLYISGIAAAGPDMKAAVDKAYSVLSDLLKQHGSSMGHVVKETLFTTDMIAMQVEIETRKKYFPEDQYPASSWIEVNGLFLPELILEVEVEAIIQNNWNQ